MFKIGDRVQLNAEALKHCDPAIGDNEIKGTVTAADFTGAHGNEIVVKFDNGDVEQHPASWFELETF